MPLSTGPAWLDAPCETDFDYEGGCELEYVFDLTGAAAPSTNATEPGAVTPALTPSPSAALATEAAATLAPATDDDVEEPSTTPAPSTSSHEATDDSMDATTTLPPSSEVEEITPAPATTGTDSEDTLSPEAAADSVDAVTAPTTEEDGGAAEDIADQDTSPATGRCAPATAAWMTSSSSLLVAVVVTLMLVVG